MPDETNSPIYVQVNKEQLKRVTDELAAIPYGLPRVLSRAINKVGVAARTQVLRMIVREINVHQKDIRQKNVVLRLASLSKLWARLSITGKRIPLIDFHARQIGRGVSYAIRRGGRKLLPHGFIQRMPSGHVGVFVRSGVPRLGRQLRTRRGPGRGMAGLVRPRLPIAERFGPSVPQVVRDAEEFASGTFERLLHTKLAGEIEMQVRVLLERRAREVDSVPI